MFGVEGKNMALQPKLTGMAKNMDKLFDMVGGIFKGKIIRFSHQMI